MGRIVLGMSLTDIIAQAAWMLQPYLVPRETSQRVWAIGNDETCVAVGVLTQLGMSTFWYSCSLSFYFLSTIRYGVKDEIFSKTWEPWIHAMSTGWFAVTAAIGAVIGAYD